HVHVVGVRARHGPGIPKGQIAGLEADERLAGGELLNHGVKVLNLLCGERARLRHDRYHQQCDAEGLDATDLGHVVSPWSRKRNWFHSRAIFRHGSIARITHAVLHFRQTLGESTDYWRAQEPGGRRSSP